MKKLMVMIFILFLILFNSLFRQESDREMNQGITRGEIQKRPGGVLPQYPAC